MVQIQERGQFLAKVDVSRETIERLDKYEALLRKWNPAINLVGKSTLNQIWSRHFLDSAQILKISKFQHGHWVDIGTGGGFPGLVIAAITADLAPGFKFSFVESDLRKATFLRTAIRELGLEIDVFSERIENLDNLEANVISVRALASLEKLLEYSNLHLKHGGQAILMKGATFRKEISEALENWSFHSDEYTSITDPTAVILSIGDLKRV